MSTPIDIEITITGGVATYKCTNQPVSPVQPNGTISISVGEDAVITFVPADGQGWLFSTPTGVTISPTGKDISIVSQSASSVVLADTNHDSRQGSTYSYTLFTTQGPLDPAIINKGT